INLLYSHPERASIFCSSSDVPSVVTTIAWVSPLVKRAEPWVLGRSPTSQLIGLISASPLPSILIFLEITDFLNMWYLRSSNIFIISSSLPSQVDLSASINLRRQRG